MPSRRHDRPRPHSQKSVSGRPPVATKNLRVRAAGAFPKQKSRRVAAPRRSVDGTCEKPATDAASLSRVPVPGHYSRGVSQATTRTVVAAQRHQGKEAERLSPAHDHSMG